MMIDLESLFWQLDDSCQLFELEVKGKLLPSQTQKRHRESRLTLSEVTTIIIYFHCSNYRCFKNYYTNCIVEYHSKDFPNLVSYNRFVELIPQALMPLLFYLNTRKGENTGNSCRLTP